MTPDEVATLKGELIEETVARFCAPGRVTEGIENQWTRGLDEEMYMPIENFVEWILDEAMPSIVERLAR